jgi:hypothetical protein
LKAGLRSVRLTLGSSVTKEIPLTKGAVALVDEEDYAWLSAYRWHAHGRRYAARWANEDGKRRLVYMHRQILGTGPGEQTDHKNGDGLDNRRENLRFCTSAENLRNSRKYRRKGGATSRYKGVSWHRRGGKWQACVQVGGKGRHLGHFADERAAALAYDRAAVEHFGEFARPNFPDDVLFGHKRKEGQ